MNDWITMQERAEVRHQQRKQDFWLGVHLLLAGLILSGVYVLIVKIGGGW